MQTDTELRGELALIGPKEFRRKYGSRAFVDVPQTSINYAKAILAELDRAEEEAYRAKTVLWVRLTAVFTGITALAAVIAALTVLAAIFG